ncbi:MAG: glycosyltransferase involved in cell wall biosynthesis [Colwellia sp.]|jgi:glycosyltransferase involved in cell wall biosynthesis
MKNFILITPVHNEESLIGLVIDSVVEQTLQPIKWIIINDRSTDLTQPIIESYAKKYSWITVSTLSDNSLSSYYGRKTEVLLYGMELLAKCDIKYDYVGCLDADITLPSNYYESILGKFDLYPELGICSGVYMDLIDNQPRVVHRSSISTPGAIQLFQKKCYEEIGGYIPMPFGGEDSIAEIMARQYGWKTRSYLEYSVIHHRPSGTGVGQSIYKARFYQGKADFGIGSHPIFMLAKTFSRGFSEKPLIIGSCCRFIGYMHSVLFFEKRSISHKTVSFLRKEQMQRLYKTLFGLFKYSGVKNEL